MKRLSAIVTAVALAGCSVGPSYEPPKIDLPPQFAKGTPDCGDISEWWKVLGDPMLDSLVERALANNLDVRKAEAALLEGRALRGAAIADFLPDLNLDGSLTKRTDSHNSRIGRQPGANLRSDDYKAGFDASWEIDLWGGKRRSLEQTNATYEQSEEDLHDVLVSLCAEVARNYIDYRGSQRRLAIAAEGLRGQQAILDLTRSRFDAGVASDLDVARGEAEVESLKARIPTLEASGERARHRLAVLLGQWPATLDGELAEMKPIPVPPAAAPGGLPADLLARRPDLRHAERLLAAATANIGVRVDAMLPHVSLLGTAGLESLDSQLFFKASSATWSIGPSISWRIFSLPELYCQVQAADARAEQALLAYRQAVLRALSDVEDALSDSRGEDVRRAALTRAVAANERAVNQSRDLYKQGLASFLDVLEADKALLNAQNELALSDAAVATNRVALYKALGGGWKMEEEGK